MKWYQRYGGIPVYVVTVSCMLCFSFTFQIAFLVLVHFDDDDDYDDQGE